MKVLTLKINGTTHATAKITAYNARQALKIQQESLGIAETAERLGGEAGVAETNALINAMIELRDKKTLLIVDVYGYKFSPEDLEKELSDNEIDLEISRIINGISGVIEKN